jgi:hypothetical protein
MNEERRQQAEAEIAYAAERCLAEIVRANKVAAALSPERISTPTMILAELKGVTRSALYHAAFSREEIASIDREPLIRAAMEMQGIPFPA